MVVTFKWALSNFLKLFAIYFLRSLLIILLVNHNGICFVQWYPKKWVMNGMDFLFQNADTKVINLNFVRMGMVMSALINVTEQNLDETFVVIFQRHLLTSQIKFKQLMKKVLKDIVNVAIFYCIIWFVTIVTKSAHFRLFSSYATLPLLCISKWGDDIP